MAARNRLAAIDEQARYIDRYLAFELGGDEEDYADGGPGLVGVLAAAGGDPSRSKNKQSMKLFKDRARDGVK